MYSFKFIMMNIWITKIAEANAARITLTELSLN